MKPHIIRRYGLWIVTAKSFLNARSLFELKKAENYCQLRNFNQRINNANTRELPQG